MALRVAASEVAEDSGAQWLIWYDTVQKISGLFCPLVLPLREPLGGTLGGDPWGGPLGGTLGGNPLGILMEYLGSQYLQSSFLFSFFVSCNLQNYLHFQNQITYESLKNEKRTTQFLNKLGQFLSMCVGLAASEQPQSEFSVVMWFSWRRVVC